MKKTIPLLFVLIGTALLITAVIFWIDSRTSAEPQNFGQSLRDWITLIAGLGASIKGWVDLLKKESTSQPTQNNTGSGVFLSGKIESVGEDVVGRDKVINYFPEDKSYNVDRLKNPYLGLRAFTYKDRDRYAGREALAEEALQILTSPGEQCNLLFIKGASGSGKSSFAQAGLLPVLISHYKQRGLEVTFDVFHPANKPMARLDDVCSKLLPGKVQVIIVDQFEELFTQSLPTERDAFLNWLYNLPPFKQSLMHVIATLRSDYFGEVFDNPSLWPIIKAGIELHKMSVDEIKEAIQRPLQARFANSGKHFEPPLVERLARDAAGDVTYLPLLQVTLEDIWKKGQLRLSSYNSLTDAIKDRADTVLTYRDFDKASPGEVRTQAERRELMDVLLNLINTSLDDDAKRDVRISRHMNEFTSSQKAIISDLSRARLLSVENNGTEETVNLIHETLIRSWEALSEGIRSRRIQLQKRARFEYELGLWLSHNEAAGYLLSEGPLADALDLDQLGDISLQKEEAQRFLQSSILRLESEKQQARLPGIMTAIADLAKAFGDEQDLLNAILDRAVEFLNTEAGNLILVDEQTGELVFQAISGPLAGSLLGQRIPGDRGIAGRAVQLRVPVLENSIQLPLYGFEDGYRLTAQSALAVPMLLKDKVLGVIMVMNRKDSMPFTVVDQSFLTLFAGQVAITIENQRLNLKLLTNQELAKQSDEFSVQQRIDREFNAGLAGLDIERAMRVTLELAMDLSRAKAGLISIIEGDRLRMMAQQGYDGVLSEGSELEILLSNPAIRSAIESRQPNQISLIENGLMGILPSAFTQIIVPIHYEMHVIALLILETADDLLDDTTFLVRISERAAIAITNAQLYDEVQRANLAKSDFVSFVAHELKNPMTSIRGYTELLAAGSVGQINEMQSNFLSTIRSSVDRMSALISDLNDNAKIEANRLRLDFRPVEAAEVVDDVMRSTKRQVEDKRQSIDLQLASSLPLVWADRLRVGQVLTNLVSNAHKYTPEGGQIVVGAETTANHWDPDGARRVVHLWVKDNGIGISLDDQAKIFQKFFRSDDSKAREVPGTGLGLNVTKSLVEMMGGRIWFESEFRKGTTFHFTIPVAEE